MEDPEDGRHLSEKLPEKKVPIRTTFCPKCYLFGAVMDYRNEDRLIVTSNKIVDQHGNATRVIKKLVYTLKCPHCGEVERKVR